jgi:DNA-directed RNA polymerase subunit RPC12/RpoP
MDLIFKEERIMIIKDNDYVCPRCGGGNCSALDSDCDIDGGMVSYECDDCGARWREYYVTRYDGYGFEEKVYDKNGRLLWDAAEERRKWEESRNGSN